MLDILLAVTEREVLQALVRAAGLRISGDDLDALLPAWRRYQKQVAFLRQAVEENARE
jgi:hypothetical protein